MNHEKKDPVQAELNRKELKLTGDARAALNVGEVVRSMSLIEQITSFWGGNLITLMSIAVFQGKDRATEHRAEELFQEHLRRCTKTGPLHEPANWIRNPKRKFVSLKRFSEAIDVHRRILEPNWDGVWHEPGTGPTNTTLALARKLPEDVADTRECLVMASQAGYPPPWIRRYLHLGGNVEDPKYLKILVSIAVPEKKKPTPYILASLRKFARLCVEVAEVRTFLRGITPTYGSISGKNPNVDIAKCALFVYCECDRFDRTVDDWVHIAKSAMYLRLEAIEKLTQSILAGLDRTSEAETILAELIRKHGEVRTLRQDGQNLGIPNNPIWQSVYRLVPVNADAKRILAAYSRCELDRFQ